MRSLLSLGGRSVAFGKIRARGYLEAGFFSVCSFQSEVTGDVLLQSPESIFPGTMRFKFSQNAIPCPEPEIPSKAPLNFRTEALALWTLPRQR